MLAYGFIFTRSAYLKSAWNVLDFFVVLVSVIALLAQDLPGLAPLRMLRILRPLRLLAQHGGMRVILESLVDSIPAVRPLPLRIGHSTALSTALSTAPSPPPSAEPSSNGGPSAGEPSSGRL